MPDDRTLQPVEPPPPEKRRRPDRIVQYARRGAFQLVVVIAVIAGLMMLLELLFYEVLGDRGDPAQTVRRALVASTAPIVFLVVLVRRAR